MSRRSFGKKDRKKRNEASQLTKTVSWRQSLESDFLTVVAYFEKNFSNLRFKFPFLVNSIYFTCRQRHVSVDRISLFLI